MSEKPQPTVSDARKAKAALEQTLIDLLRQFTEDTDLTVESIRVDSRRTYSGKIAGYSVTVDVKLY